MISLITTWPIGDGSVPLKVVPTTVLAPETGCPCRSRPTAVNELLPGCSGMTARQVVTLSHVRGQGTALKVIVWTTTGAVPVMTTVLLTTLAELMLKELVLAAASWLAMLL